MSEPNQSDELLEQFRTQLKGPFSEIYFSEEELISIFDTAGDANDDYVRQEALMVGARLYPDSEALLARRGIFYNQTDPVVFNRFIADHNDNNSDLMKLLKLDNFKGSPAEAEAIISEMFATGNFDDDEFVIQFVQAVHRLGQDRWLAEHFDDIYAKVTYKPTLLYEIGIIAQENPELRPLAIKCLEELTETDPFSADFWSMLGYLYFITDDREKSASAIEYALAIDPEHIEALKGSLRLLDPDKEGKKVAEMLVHILHLSPDPDLFETALAMARGLERPDAIRELLDIMPDDIVPSFNAVACAVYSNYSELNDLLIRAVQGGLTAPEDWRTLLELAYSSGHPELVVRIRDIYSELTGSHLDHEYIDYIAMWETGDYEGAIELFKNADPTGTLRLTEHFFEGVILYITMLLRVGRINDASDMAMSLSNAINDGSPLPGSRIERLGAGRIISNIVNLCAEGHSADFWETFDPFALRS